MDALEQYENADEEGRKKLVRNIQDSLMEIWIMTQRALEGMGLAPLEEINEIAKKGLGMK